MTYKSQKIKLVNLGTKYWKIFMWLLCFMYAYVPIIWTWEKSIPTSDFKKWRKSATRWATGPIFFNTLRYTEYVWSWFSMVTPLPLSFPQSTTITFDCGSDLSNSVAMLKNIYCCVIFVAHCSLYCSIYLLVGYHFLKFGT